MDASNGRRPPEAPTGQTLDEHIAEQLASSMASGELQAAPSWGKPLDFGDGYDETPVELRMGFKILKDAGVVPHEVTMLREVAELKRQLAAEADPDRAASVRRRIAELQQAVALRLEKLAHSRSF
jgi:hypothetical protein